MTNNSVAVALATFTILLGVAAGALAQDGPGTRAAGMGGAFVAVADDASAVYWNPAGLASGPLFNLQIDIGRTEVRPGTPGDVDARGGRQDFRLVAFGVPPLGVGYYRLARVRAVPASPAVPGAVDRQEGGLLAERLTTSHVGLTLLQSVGGGIAVGTTLKLVRGSLATGVVSGGGWSEVLDRGQDLEATARTRADLDVGVMLNAGRVRLGLVARNLREPDFAPDGVDDPAARLEREVRMGVAWGATWPGLSPLIASLDVDVTRVTDIDGERRDVAAGVETWWMRHRLGLRGG